MQRALDLDPLSLIIATDLGHMFYLARQYDRAIEQYHRVIEMDRGFVMAHWRLGEVFQRLRRWSDAAAAFRASGLDSLERVADALVDQPLAGEDLHKLSARFAVVKWGAYPLAQSMAAVGAVDDALVELERARAEHEPELVFVTADPSFDALRDDPRFATLVRAIAPAGDRAVSLAR